MSIKFESFKGTGGGAVTGGLVYKGSYNATTSSPSLVTAKKGDFYIFPAYLYHMVYPFKGNKKRITASINYGLETITK